MLTAAWRLVIQLIHRLGFASFELSPPLLGGFLGIHSWRQVGFFQKIAPAVVTIVWGLAMFKLSDGLSCVLVTTDDLNYARGYVSANVVPDDRVRNFRFVACQKCSACWLGLFNLARP